MPQLAEILNVDQAELDALRPGAVSAATAAEESEGDAGPSTIEQPAVPTDAEPEEPSAEVVVAPRRRGLLGDVATAWQVMTEGWTGWIRGFATAAVLLVLLVVLVWAASELFQALGEVWDSFDAGS